MVKQYDNKTFDQLASMTAEDFEILSQEKRLWSTRALFTGRQAMLVMGPPPVGWHYSTDKIYYHGHIITEKGLDLEEAKRIAGERGFNEEVVWLIEGTAPMGDQPMQLFQN